MLRVIRRTSDFVLRTFVVLCATIAIAAQQPLAFDVASIKPNNSGAVGEQVRFFPPSGRVALTNVTVKRLVQQAYELQESQLTGGPSWIASEHFDIVANSERANLSPPQRWEMIKALLIDRFKLQVHTESKEQSVFALVRSRKDGALGEHLHQVNPDCAPPTVPRAPFDPAHPPPCGTILGGPGRIKLLGVPMEWVAKQLADRVGRAVVDRTGLDGRFDVELEFAPQLRGVDIADPSAADRPADGAPSIYTALQEQLGLKLESQKTTVDVTVIDHVEHPTEG
jgi:uncharacterized protein (TIGR03435 family)